MSDLYAHIVIKDAAVEPLGVKEAMAMQLEPLGGVQVLSVETREPEQLGIGAGAFASKPKPTTTSRGGQAPARSSRRSQTAMECCYTCACYRSDRNRDADGKPYWGVCGRTGQPVYDLKNRCGAWAQLGG